MDLRNLPEQLSASERINQRRTLIERELGISLRHLEPQGDNIGESEKKNCEQMFGMVSVPVGYAGPLRVTFSNKCVTDVHLPIATTEGALVASINRGCKATMQNGIVITRTVHHGITRSIAFRASSSAKVQELFDTLRTKEAQWKAVAHGTSDHLRVQTFTVDLQKQYVFLTIACDTEEAMGMNMVTIAAQAIADWVSTTVTGVRCITIAGNVDSDKKPSKRTHDLGRGFEVHATTVLSKETLEEVLKTTPEAMMLVSEAKLIHGSTLAGALGSNLHVANMIAALYLATGQDIAHTVEGSLADTTVEETQSGLKISVRIPAILVGIRGGGTMLPSQAECLSLLLKNKSGLKMKQQLAESIAAAILAGEVSLLAAQTSHDLAKAHVQLAR